MYHLSKNISFLYKIYSLPCHIYSHNPALDVSKHCITLEYVFIEFLFIWIKGGMMTDSYCEAVWNKRMNLCCLIQLTDCELQLQSWAGGGVNPRSYLDHWLSSLILVRTICWLCWIISSSVHHTVDFSLATPPAWLPGCNPTWGGEDSGGHDNKLVVIQISSEKKEKEHSLSYTFR